MSAYDRGNLSPEAYLVRILAGIVRQNGGEVRIKGENIDHIGEATFIIKEWDATKQELVLRAGMHDFSEVFRVNPEMQRAQMPQRQPVDPLTRLPAEEFLPKRSTLDDDRVAALQRQKEVAQSMAVLRDELARRNKRGPNGAD